MVTQNLRKPALFIGLTFFVSWLLAFVFNALGLKWNMLVSLLFTLAYMFIPMTVAIIVQKIVYKEPLKEPLGISFKMNRWFLVAWLLPPVLAFASLGLSLLFPGVNYSPRMEGFFEQLESVLTPEQLEQMKSQASAFPIHPIWIGLLQGLVAGITINAVAAFGEELGWRGLLQKEFSYMGFWKSSVVIGTIWGIWHAPMILQGYNYPEHPVMGAFMMTLLTLLLSPIFSYVRLKAKSVIAAAIIHGTLNGTARLAIIVIRGNELIIGVTGLAGLIVLALANIGLFAYDRLWAKEPITTK